MLGMKNHFDISGIMEIREVDIAGVACILNFSFSVGKTPQDRNIHHLKVGFN